MGHQEGVRALECGAALVEGKNVGEEDLNLLRLNMTSRGIKSLLNSSVNNKLFSSCAFCSQPCYCEPTAKGQTCNQQLFTLKTC